MASVQQALLAVALLGLLATGRASTAASAIASLVSIDLAEEVEYEVQTLAGNGAAVNLDGQGWAAAFQNLVGVAVGRDGTIYATNDDPLRPSLTSHDHDIVRSISPKGEAATFAGRAGAGFADGSAQSAIFNGPSGLTVDNEGAVFVADSEGNQIRKIQDGQVTTIAGSSEKGTSDGSGREAQFKNPVDVAVNPKNGHVFVLEFNPFLRKLVFNPLTGKYDVFTMPGDLSLGNPDFFAPTSLVQDANGDFYVADEASSSILVRSRDGRVRRVAGGNGVGFADGVGPHAEFQTPRGLALGPNNTILITDTGANTLRKLYPDGTVVTIAGSPGSDLPALDGPGLQARFESPNDVAYDPVSGTMYVADRTAVRTVRIAEAPTQAPTQPSTRQPTLTHRAGRAPGTHPPTRGASHV